MVQIFDNQTGAPLGTLSDEQFEFMASRLEEETDEDNDYYLNRTTVDTFEAEGAAPELVAILRRALGSGEEAEIRWSRA